MSNGAHVYAGERVGRGTRLLSKIGSEAITLDRLEALIGRRPGIAEPPPPEPIRFKNQRWKGRGK